jgi:signal transduction histidine kinase
MNMDHEEKSQKRVEKLFSEMKQIMDEPPAADENPPAAEVVPPAADGLSQSPPADNIAVQSEEMDALIERIIELETKIQVSEMRAVLAEAQLAAAKDETQKTGSAPAIIYEKEEVGYAYRADSVLPLQMVDIKSEELENVVETPLVASGKNIGEIKVEPPAERQWTSEEDALAHSVAQQASLQIQNLRLLAATERARAEAQAATRQFTHESWESFLDGIRNSERIGYKYDQAAVEPFTAPRLEDHDHRETVKVSDEYIGNLFVKADPAHPLTDEDKTMLAAVAQRVAQQVESLRLLADASRARAEAEEATRRLSRESWQVYAQQHTTQGYVYDSNQVIPLAQATPNIKNISMVQPLTVRGETIGQIALAGMNNVTSEANELAAIIAERISAQLEQLRLSEEIQKRAAELATVAAVSTAASTILDPNELLQQVVDLTKERFNLYHAHIYLADESWNTLLLAAGAGGIGKQMVMSGHAIPLDHATSIVARCARERKAIVSNNVRTDADYFPNPMLPDTRSEMAVPMTVGDKVLGVLDVQADVVDRFTDEDVNIKTTLVTQVAIALQNARLYVEQSETVSKLRELDRLKSSFLANMSHELRTPLNSILGFADVMLEELDGPLTENMKNDLGLIYKNGQHLLHLINDVLDMAKIESGKMNLNLEKFNLQEIIEEVTSITAPLASEKNLALFIEQDSDHEVDIIADKIRIRQVMINLINNAIKFTEKGKIAIHVTREGKSVLISVKDTGLGIPHDHLEAVFQEFTQVDTTTTRKVGGTGLGLPISRRLIEMHGGRLWAESAGVEGEGSTFYVYLPLEARIKEEKEKAK